MPFVVSTLAVAQPLPDYTFKSPAFNGNGYSSHELTIENLEHTRKEQLKKDLQSALDKEANDKKNTNLAKFLNNLESRIYAQISQNVATAMFADSTQCHTFYKTYHLDFFTCICCTFFFFAFGS